MTRPDMRTSRRRRERDRTTTILTVIFGILALATAVVAFILIRNFVGSWSLTGLPGAPKDNGTGLLGQATPAGTAFVQPLQPETGPTAQPWDGKSRITLLLLGLDGRDWEAGQIPRSDTMILLTLDPISNTAGMLSIPRDMWVNIPGFDYAKINTAFYLGEAYKLPGGGPGLAVKTVEEFLGVPINFYAQVDFNAFVMFIDELGGLDMHIKEEITVDPIGPGNTVTLYPGVQVLDGATTLAYARARYTEGDDFSRSQRQQEVIFALRDDIINFNMLPTLITKAPALYRDLSSGIHTNMNLQQMVSLGLLAAQVPRENIKQAVISTQEVLLSTSPDGLSILIPINDKIRMVRDQIFTTNGSVGPQAAATDPVVLVTSENARISIQNGTQSADLASRTAAYFRNQGMNIVEETNADQLYDSTTIVVVNGKPYTAKSIATLMNVSTSHIYNRFEPDSYADIIVILGNDWANNNPMQ